MAYVKYALRKVGAYIFEVLIAIDQVLTTLIGGYADETLSSYAYRLEQRGHWLGYLRPIIDMIFFFQPLHCFKSYLATKDRRYSPPEFRDASLPSVSTDL